MKSQDVIDYFGSIKATADALCITTQAVYSWGSEIPTARQAHIQLATRGRIKKDKVSRVKSVKQKEPKQ